MMTGSAKRAKGRESRAIKERTKGDTREIKKEGTMLIMNVRKKNGIKNGIMIIDPPTIGAHERCTLVI